MKKAIMTIVIFMLGVGWGMAVIAAWKSFIDLSLHSGIYFVSGESVESKCVRFLALVAGSFAVFAYFMFESEKGDK